MLTLTNSLTKKKSSFIPLKDKIVTLYTCGVTPYDHAHLGHGRCYVSFDLLLRTLKLCGYQVTYARNFTDIDDKIINKAAAQGCNYHEIAQRYMDSFHEDMVALNCLPPTVEPLVTTHIPEIIAFIEGLIKNGNAYVQGHDVYFDISTFASYGKLSGRAIDEMIAGSRVAVNDDKRNPGDFALWKGNDQQEYWQSPWGYGRPGWHIECSAMALKHLGQTIDIHAGGMDLMFPHHENEIAQTESLTGKPFAQVWLHNAFINVNAEKMSKSLGNMVNLRDTFAQYHPMILRFYYLQHHYRTPIDFTISQLAGTATAYKKLLPLATAESLDLAAFNECAEQLPIIQQMVEALCDDLNSVKFFGILFEHLATIKQTPVLASAAKYLLQASLGLTLEAIDTEIVYDDEITALIAEREQARKDKNWQRADALRNELLKRGVTLQDIKTK